MRKILIRSGIMPFDKVPFDTMIRENRLGSNVGNLVYAYSIYKTLWDEDTEFILTKYRYNYSEEEIEQLNQECTCFIIPLADAIRQDFVKEMKGLTRLVKALHIPCFVIGIGVRAPYEPEKNFCYSFDGTVKDFLKAVLEKSSIIGVRGKITADYFSRLGFKEETDFTVIGCPSMYMFGRHGIHILDKIINFNSTVCYNENVLTTDEISDFIRKNATKFREYYFIPQQVKELKIMYAGIPYKEKLPEGFPHNITDEVYVNGKSLFFGSVPSWIEFMKKIDFCFGSRLHGNIVATLAGTPSILFPFDARARELADYHNLTNVPYNKVNENTGILELIDKIDFHSPEKCQSSNFDHYIDFLNKNRIDHIYKKNSKIGDAFERQVRQRANMLPLQSITQVTAYEIAERLQIYNEWQYEVKDKEKKSTDTRISQLKLELKEKKIQNEEKIAELYRIIQEKDELIKYQNRKLNYKSIKAIMYLRDELEKAGILKKIKGLMDKRNS